MERLTKRYEHYDIIDLTARTNTNCSVICHEMSDCESCPVNVALSKLADYEDAEEQGLLLRLPCKVGDTVYHIEDGYIYEFKARSIDVRKENEEYIFCIDSMDYTSKDFGRIVFLTLEEAEAALAEKGGA